MKTGHVDMLKIFQRTVFWAVFFLLPACDLYEESWTTKNRVQVEESRYFKATPVAEFDAATIEKLAHEYSRFGDGAVNVTITYDPSSKDFTAMKATNESARIAQQLKKAGLKEADVSIMPVRENAQTVMVSYMSYSALPPEDCTNMPGYEGRDDFGKDADYALGCTIESVFAKQISRPKDLKGQAQTQTTVDGRRVGNTVDFYRDGLPNESLEGESASD